jgi:sterol desaturase/sphingolipid hydroxylase (fatty acid hydroxylase superfamily)
LRHPESLQTIVMLKGGVLVVVLMLLEWRFPYDLRWRMTWRHLLRRDAAFIAANGAVFWLLGYVPLLLALDLSTDTVGIMTGQPLWAQVLVGLVAFEAMQYSVHRWMHESRGPLTNWLWRTHAIHHLPQQLYVVMHAVFHPFNAVVIRAATHFVPLLLLGYDPEAVFVYGSVIALQGTVSHLNLDVRAGWMNYLFVGPELHRYHHSARSHEAVNYAAVLAPFDLLFRTFHYQPGRPPEDLGLRETDGYPGQHAPLRALLFPFRTAVHRGRGDAPALPRLR